VENILLIVFIIFVASLKSNVKRTIFIINEKYLRITSGKVKVCVEYFNGLLEKARNKERDVR
jgi:hypothetical protein